MMRDIMNILFISAGCLLVGIALWSLTGCASLASNESPRPNSCYLQKRTIYETCYSGGTFVGIESYSSAVNVFNVCCTPDKAGK